MRNFSPARKVLSITLPSSMRRSFVRTKAPPLPGLTCWNSTIFQTLPSISIWDPLRNWFVLTDIARTLATCRADLLQDPGDGSPPERRLFEVEFVRPPGHLD